MSQLQGQDLAFMISSALKHQVWILKVERKNGYFLVIYPLYSVCFVIYALFWFVKCIGAFFILKSRISHRGCFLLNTWTLDLIFLMNFQFYLLVNFFLVCVILKKINCVFYVNILHCRRARSQLGYCPFKKILYLTWLYLISLILTINYISSYFQLLGPQQRLDNLMRQAGNRYCADCGSLEPKWV